SRAIVENLLQFREGGRNRQQCGLGPGAVLFGPEAAPVPLVNFLTYRAERVAKTRRVDCRVESLLYEPARLPWNFIQVAVGRRVDAEAGREQAGMLLPEIDLDARLAVDQQVGPRLGRELLVAGAIKSAALAEVEIE